MPQTTVLHVQVDEETGSQAEKVLSALGLSMSDAVRILLKRIISEQAFPLNSRYPTQKFALRSSKAGSKCTPE